MSGEIPMHGAGLDDRGLVRVGDTVRRPSGEWTSSVHHLLRYLRDRGFDLAPEPLGRDEKGREILGFLPGHDQGWPMLPHILTDAGAHDLGLLARRLREAIADYPCPPDARWQSGAGVPSPGKAMRDGSAAPRTGEATQHGPGVPSPGEALQHGDLGPWNLLWDDAGRITGVLDWDLAEPGDPFYDTGFLAWFTVPFMNDERAHARGFPTPPDRRARRAAFAEGAGVTPDQLTEIVHATQTEFARRIVTRDGVWRTFRDRGFHENALTDRSERF